MAIAGTSRCPVSKLLACCITADIAEGGFFNVVQLSRCNDVVQNMNIRFRRAAGLCGIWCRAYRTASKCQENIPNLAVE
jgi:hypothetical protein